MAVNQIRFPGTAGSAPDSALWTRATYSGNTDTDTDLDGNGNLRMQVRNTGTGTYSSCRVDTHGKYAVPPESYVEWTALLPTSAGCFPGLFMVGANEGVAGQTWPGVGEIDTVEVAGYSTKARFNLISTRISNSATKIDTAWPNNDTTVPSLPTKWHRYGTFFGANGIQNYTDRKLTSQYTPAQLAAADQAWPYGAAAGFYLALTFSAPTAPMFAGDPSTTTWPQYLLVSAIDVYPAADWFALQKANRFLGTSAGRFRRTGTLQ